MIEQEKQKSMAYILKMVEDVYNNNFTMSGLIDGHENFDNMNKFNEGFKFLLEACTDNRIPEETHGLLVSSLTLMYAYARDIS